MQEEAHEVGHVIDEASMRSLLDQAVYGQDRYEFRIMQFKKLLSMMNWCTSTQFVHAYINALQGLFTARAKSDLKQLVLLRNLFLKVHRAERLKKFHVQFNEWMYVVNQDLITFALKDGDIVRIRNSQLNEFLYALTTKRVNTGVFSLFLTSDRKMDVQVGASLFRIRKNSGVGKVVHYSDSVSFEPLYVQVSNFIYTAPEGSAISLISSVRRGKGFNDVGIRWGQTPQGDDYLFTVKRSSDIRLREEFFTGQVPVLADEEILVIHDGTGKAFTSTAESNSYYVKARLSVKKIGLLPVAYRAKEGSPLLSGRLVFALRRVSQEELGHIRHAQFDYLLKWAKEHDVMGDKVAAYEAALHLLTPDIMQAKQDVFAYDLRKLFHEREANSKLLRSMRRLFVQAATHNVFESRRLEFEHYVGQINKDLVPLGLQYGAVVRIRSRHQGQRLLWTHGDSRYQSGGHLEVVAGPNDHECVTKGPQLFKILSASGKTGTVLYGDPIEFVALYAGAGTTNGSLGRGQKFWVNPNSYCGKQFYEILVGPNNCNQAQNGQEEFFLRPHDHFATSIATRANPVLLDDVLEIWSHQFSRKLWVNPSSLSVENSHEILVGPNDDNYRGVNRTKNGQQLFTIERVVPEQATAIADADFYTRLRLIKRSNIFERRMHAMQDLYLYGSENEVISGETKQAFVEEIQELFSTRQGVDEQQLTRFMGFLAASNTEFFEWEQRKLIHGFAETLAFEKTERLIDHGMAQAGQQRDYVTLIDQYNKLVPLMESKYASRRTKGFIAKLYNLVLQTKSMEARELNALKALLSHALQINYGLEEDNETAPQLVYLYEVNKELTFKAQLAEAAQAQGSQQIRAYKTLLPHAHQMTEKQRIELIRSLKNIFESKINEIKEIRGVLEKANTRELSQ